MSTISLSCVRSVLCQLCFLSLCPRTAVCFAFFFFNDTATTEIYTLSLHDALPILRCRFTVIGKQRAPAVFQQRDPILHLARSEEHTSELQSQSNLVCRLLLEKKKNKEATSRERMPISPIRPGELAVDRRQLISFSR